MHRNKKMTVNAIEPTTEWRLFSGREQLAAFQPELIALAARCGQNGAMDHLNNLTSVPYYGFGALVDQSGPSKLFSYLRAKRPKIPKLLLEVGSEGLTAAVLLFEYQAYGIPTGAFISADADGWRTVVAQPERRAAAAQLAAKFLLARGAKRCPGFLSGDLGGTRARHVSMRGLLKQCRTDYALSDRHPEPGAP